MRGQGEPSFDWDSPRHWEIIDECETTSGPEAREKLKSEYLSWLEDIAKASRSSEWTCECSEDESE